MKKAAQVEWYRTVYDDGLISIWCNSAGDESRLPIGEQLSENMSQTPGEITAVEVQTTVTDNADQNPNYSDSLRSFWKLR